VMTNALLCEIHRQWLWDIYEWAGRYRTVNLTKGDFRWPPPGRIAANRRASRKGSSGEKPPVRGSPSRGPRGPLPSSRRNSC
jgi:cell filamentation protein